MIEQINNLQQANPARQITNPAKPTESPTETSPVKNTDEYIPSEDKEPIGLYRPIADDDGKRGVEFDAPEQPEVPAETTTGNTDAVDREIKALKERRAALQKQLRGADEESAAEISRKLEQIENELMLKDNDEYRRANTVFS